MPLVPLRVERYGEEFTIVHKLMGEMDINYLTVERATIWWNAGPE